MSEKKPLGRPPRPMPKVNMTAEQIAHWIFDNAKSVKPVPARPRRNRA